MTLLALLALAADAAPVEVAVDARVELIGVVCGLAGVAGYDRGPDTPIRLAADAWFAPYADHPAVKEAARLQQARGLAYDQPVTLAMYLDPETLAPTWKRDRLPEALADRWDPKEARAFAGLLADFAEEARFEAFLAENDAYADAVEGRYRDFLAERHVVGWFDGFFGPVDGGRYTVVPGLLHGTGNFGLSVPVRGGRHFRPVLGAGRVDEAGLPMFDRSTELLLVHELAHGRVNPAIDARADAIEAGATAALASAGDRMTAIGYGSWEAVAYETGVRAVVVLYAADRHDARGEALAAEEARGFWWTADVVDVLERCRQDGGGRCDDLAVPEVGAALEAFAASPRTPPFRGPINAALEGPWVPDRFALVVPSGSTALASYVGKVNAALFGGRVPVLDPTAIGDETRGLMLYGSPSTNVAVAGLLDRFAWEVDADGIRFADQVFEGPDLVLFATRSHPDDPSLPVVLLTAADDATLVPVHSFFAGPKDWVVAKRAADGTYTIVGEGDFPVE